MTLKELNNLRYIDGEIRMLEEHIEELRAQAERTTPNVTTYIQTNPQTGKKETCVLPSTGGAGAGHSRVEDGAVNIDGEKRLLETTRAKRKQEKQKLLEFIQTIPDSQTRQIFTYRFVDTLTWGQVARKIGGNNTADSIRKKAMLYVD